MRSLNFPFIFKASYDKANRTSIRSYRGPGIKEGLRILSKVKEEVHVPVLTDVHQVADVAEVADVVDVLQIPAFLCRQTDLIVAAALSGRPVNIKKGQFVSPWDMKHAAEKCRDAGNSQVFVTERGSTFGYNNLVVDMRSLAIMRKFSPVVFDATIPCNCPQPPTAMKISLRSAEASPNLSPFSHARLWLPAWTVYSWKSTTIRKKRKAMARMRSTRATCAAC